MQSLLWDSCTEKTRLLSWKRCAWKRCGLDQINDWPARRSRGPSSRIHPGEPRRLDFTVRPDQMPEGRMDFSWGYSLLATVRRAVPHCAALVRKISRTAGPQRVASWRSQWRVKDYEVTLICSRMTHSFQLLFPIFKIAYGRKNLGKWLTWIMGLMEVGCFFFHKKLVLLYYFISKIKLFSLHWKYTVCLLKALVSIFNFRELSRMICTDFIWYGNYIRKIGRPTLCS